MTTYINDATFDGVDGANRLNYDNLLDLDGVRGEAQVLVTLDGDGAEFHSVSLCPGQTSELTVLRRAIAVLKHAHDELEALYGDAAPVGRCTFFGEWGRCTSRADHLPGEHRTPTEEQYSAQLKERFARRAARRAAAS